MYVIILGDKRELTYVGWSDRDCCWLPVTVMIDAFFFKDYVAAFGVATSMFSGHKPAVAQIELKVVNVDEMTKKMQEQIVQMNRIVREKS